MLKLLACLVIASSVLCSCQGKKAPPASEGSARMDIKVTSTAFQEGGMIPKQYTADGKNVSPPLAWTGVPANAKSLALICDDPDAPRGTWVHWVLFNIPAEAKGLPESVPPQPKLANGAMHGNNDFPRLGYGGPAPPSGTHRYFFRLYALDAELRLDGGATRAQLDAAMKGHIIAQGQLMGKYRR